MALRISASSSSGGVAIERVNGSAELVAPCFIEVRASSITGMAVDEDLTNTWTYDPSFHEIDWQWDFGETDEAFDNSNLRLPTEKDNRNAARGKWVTHFYDTPGSYTVTLKGIDRSGGICEASRVFTIRDPAVEYPTTRTICVDPSGTYTGAPAGSQQFTTIAAARSAMNTLGTTTNRLMLARGQTFTENLNIDDSMRNVRISAFGTGDNPVWNKPSSSDNAITFGNGNLCSDFVIADVDFVGAWDSTVEGGDPDFDPLFMSTHNTATSPSVGVLRCTFDGLARLQFNAGPDDSCCAMQESHITNWQDYGIFSQANIHRENSRLHLRGVSIQQDQNACINNSGDRRPYVQNNHGPFRGADVRATFMQQCDMFSANSWGIGIQPCARLAQAGSSSSNWFGWQGQIIDNIFEGGGIGWDGQNAGAANDPGNWLVDGNIILSTWAVGYSMVAGHGGTTIRNNVMIALALDAPTQHIDMNIDLDGNGFGDAPYYNSASQFDCYGNTFVSYGTSSLPISNGSDDWDSPVFTNNVDYQPNAGVNADAPIDQTESSGITPLNIGKREGPQFTSNSISAVSNGGTVDVALPSGYTDADYSTGNSHLIRVGFTGGTSYTVVDGQFTVTKLGGSTVRLTNTSGETWADGTLYFKLVADSYTTDTSFASPTTIYLPRPETTSPANNSATGVYRSYKFYDGAVRPGPSQTGLDLDGNARASTGDDRGALAATA